MHISNRPTFIPEPKEEDETYASRGEHTLDWLARSTVPRASESRRFLNEHLACLPTDHQDRMLHELRVRWKSAFFELMLARIFQELGADVALEPELDGGKRPDLEARFADGTVIVEATAPVINAWMGDKIRHRNPLLDYIESVIPQGWWVSVLELPYIGPSDSQRAFRRKTAEALDIPAPQPGASEIEILVPFDSGVARFRLTPSRSSPGGLAFEPAVAGFDDSQHRIRYVVNAKRRQVRGTEAPAILAIEASGIGSGLDDYDQALFGSSYESHDMHGNFLGRGFDADGELARGHGEPTFAAVLAFRRVGFSHIDPPVLYLHPRFSGVLPSAILRLEQRHYDPAANAIIAVEYTVPDLIDRLNLAEL